MSKTPSRRAFIQKSALALGFAGLHRYVLGSSSPSAKDAIGFGPLLDDPKGVFKLPKGFSYSSFSTRGERMDDGFFVPGAHDGMAAFPGPNGKTILVRNHEMSPDRGEFGPFVHQDALYEKAKPYLYDASHGTPYCPGGTTTLIYNTKTQSLEQHSLSLSGTLRNCSGGPTPWGSWITCEETIAGKGDRFEQDHGYCFEVPASSEMGLTPGVALKAMGRFNHEAVAVDPKSGIVYLTEDRPDGLLYRFIPKTPGKMIDGGKLQALAVKDSSGLDTRNWDDAAMPLGQPIDTVWLDLEEVESPDDDLRYRGYNAGAARFARGEGMSFGNGVAYFACTNGGPKRFGQIFKYQPSEYEGTPREAESPGRLELFIESQKSQLLKSCDNLAVAPWGDVIVCEDDGESSALVGITPEGGIYHLGHIAFESELAGACFSPDGSTLFVNLQWNPGTTLAITGPWEQRRG